MVQFRRDDSPPAPGPGIMLRRVKANQVMEFVLLGPVWGVWTHWAGNATEPCIEPKKECPGCKRGCPLRWKCYLHVWNLHLQSEEFLEITPTSTAALNDQVPSNAPLRGQRISVSRGRGEKARLRITLMPPCQVNGRLPEYRDPFSLLCKLWGFPQLHKPNTCATEVPPASVG